MMRSSKEEEEGEMTQNELQATWAQADEEKEQRSLEVRRLAGEFRTCKIGGEQHKAKLKYREALHTYWAALAKAEQAQADAEGNGKRREV